jgi:dGTP triphosphohydrolase
MEKQYSLYQEELTAAKANTSLRNRIVVGYVSGMTERELARTHAVLTGRT